jgi:hypothetical protein
MLLIWPETHLRSQNDDFSLSVGWRVTTTPLFGASGASGGFHDLTARQGGRNHTDRTYSTEALSNIPRTTLVHK